MVTSDYRLTLRIDNLGSSKTVEITVRAEGEHRRGNTNSWKTYIVTTHSTAGNTAILIGGQEPLGRIWKEDYNTRGYRTDKGRLQKELLLGTVKQICGR
jgi:hypothetical protein